MEFDPFVTEVEGCVAVGSLPKEWGWIFGGIFGGFFFRCLAGRRRRRGKLGAIVEVHVRQLQAYTNEVLERRGFLNVR